MPLTIETYTDIGRYLRDSRESLGLELNAIAAVLNIRAKYLYAIEQGDLAALPGSIYTKGYIQSYATYLGLDKDAVSTAYEQLAGARKESIFYLEPTRKEHTPDKQVILLSLALIFLIYAAWRFFMVIDKPYDNQVRDLPAFKGSIVERGANNIAVAQRPGCLNPHWQKAWPPCHYYVRNAGVRLNLYKRPPAPPYRE